MLWGEVMEVSKMRVPTADCGVCDAHDGGSSTAWMPLPAAGREEESLLEV